MSKAHTSRSLFRSTATTVAAVLLVFQLILIAATVKYVMLPMAKRSADDLAALLVLSAQTWVELPPGTRKDFELELIHKHQFMLLDAKAKLPPRTSYYPYLKLLDSALTARTGGPVSIKETDLDTTWFWADIPAGGKLVRIGFPKARLNTDPPTMLALALIATVVLTLFTALVLARRITRPLAHFSAAAQRIGEGNIPESFPETRIRELSGLAATFNQMALQVRELLANRTTMLAGISHDLRTPLARMRLAIEMLPESADPKLVARLQHDVDEMNLLIGEFLALSRDLQKEPAQEIDLDQLLTELADNARNEGARVEWHAGDCVPIFAGPVALRRILTNLLGNAIRYGEKKPVEIDLSRKEGTAVIRILDRGPGIPAQELENVFRPFYRLESSRSNSTGGSGLGLAIARQLAEANGWNIELLLRPGGGTEAKLTIHPES
ncbi:MAG: HAMP domain-containing protein [Gammaproteobacteria bacterium]|nr:HAMP domain-containing protein [Gammaproteobacteria bacterium]MBU1481357.1 HAMP domain-containing protein [Gammaproteobacteria bacterium]